MEIDYAEIITTTQISHTSTAIPFADPIKQTTIHQAPQYIDQWHGTLKQSINDSFMPVSNRTLYY